MADRDQLCRYCHNPYRAHPLVVSEDEGCLTFQPIVQAVDASQCEHRTTTKTGTP